MCSKRISQWRIDLDASWYGWHIDQEGYAHKGEFKVTKQLLRDLVSELGWKGAEKRIIEVEHGHVSSNRVCTCVDAGYVVGSDPHCPRHATPNNAADQSAYQRLIRGLDDEQLALLDQVEKDIREDERARK